MEGVQIVKRIFYIIFIFCSIFLSVTIFLNYSDAIYNAVFENKDCVIIEKKESESNEQFIKNLIVSSEETNTGLFYTTIENASAYRPTYNIYTTSISPDFINISSDWTENQIPSDIRLSTELNSSDNNYRIYGSTLYSNFSFYSLSRATELELSHSKFYIDSSTSKNFLNYLSAKGYGITVITDENRMEQSEAMKELWIMFVVLTIFMFFSVICYAFSLRKDIVIKKANGYDEFSIFKSTFLKDCLAIPVICTVISIFASLLINIFYPKSLFDYCRFASKYVLLYILASIVLFIIGCLFVQFKKSACEIRGNRPNRSLYFMSVVVRIIVSVVVIWGLTSASNAFLYKRNLTHTSNNCKSIGEDYAVLTLNSGSVDFYNNSDEYMEKCKKLIYAASEKFDAVIIDSIEFLNADEEYERTLYINSNYLKINPIYDSTGMLLDLDSISEDKTTILLPENYNGNAIKQAIENGIELDIIYYASNQYFQTFNQYVGVDSYGLIKDPLVMVINADELSWKAQSIIGEQFFLVKCESDNPYATVKEVVNECGLSNVILEAQTLNMIFDVAIMNANIKVLQYSIVSVLYLLVLIIISAFETTVYYENNKRMLIIKKIHGFGFYAYKQISLYKVIIFAIIVISTLMLNYNLKFAVLATAIDLLFFIYFIHKLERNSIVLYLKGDM